MFLPLSLAAERRLVEPGALAGRAELAREDLVVLGADVRLQRLGVLGAQALLELGDHALVGEADLADLDLAAVVEVEEVLALLLGELLDRLVHVEEAGVLVDLPPPAIDGKILGQQRALVERLALVDHRAHVHRRDLADALAFGAHAARVVVGIEAGRAAAAARRRARRARAASAPRR